jgi:CBS domain-containing protein
MNVGTILNQKGRSVSTVPPAMTLLEVAKQLAQKRIGVLIVVGADGAIEGVISERDIIRALSETGADCLQRPVAEVMTRQVVTCRETDTRSALMAMMTQRRFRHLPVVKDGNLLVGIISIGDLVRHYVAEIEMEASAMRAYIAGN